MPSVSTRAPMSAATARALDRGTVLGLREHVGAYALNAQVRDQRSRDLVDRDDEHAMMRAAQRDRCVREALAEPRRHDDQRRTPGQSAALAQEDGLRRERSEEHTSELE